MITLIVSLLRVWLQGGSGIVYRMGGTTGGSDIIAQFLEQNYGISMGRSPIGIRYHRLY